MLNNPTSTSIPALDTTLPTGLGHLHVDDADPAAALLALRRGAELLVEGQHVGLDAVDPHLRGALVRRVEDDVPRPEHALPKGTLHHVVHHAVEVDLLHPLAED